MSEYFGMAFARAKIRLDVYNMKFGPLHFRMCNHTYIIRYLYISHKVWQIKCYMSDEACQITCQTICQSRKQS